MKNIITIVFALLSFFSLSAQNVFQGKITLRSESAGPQEVSEITWYIKNGNHRLNYVNTSPKLNSNYSLLSKAGKLEMLNDNGRLEIQMDKIKKPDYNFNAYKLVNKEGKKEISGFLCTKYTIEQDGKVAEFWIVDDPELRTSDFPEFMQSGLLSVSEKLQPGGFPIQIKISESNGKLVYIQTIKEIVSMKVDEEKFK